MKKTLAYLDKRPYQTPQCTCCATFVGDGVLANSFTATSEDYNVPTENYNVYTDPDWM